MLTLSEADSFFLTHPLQKNIANFTEDERNAALVTAHTDISAAMDWAEFPEEPGELLAAAVFEQMAYLLLNPHIISGNTDASGKSMIAPRAEMLLRAITAPAGVRNGKCRTASGRTVNLGRG